MGSAAAVVFSFLCFSGARAQLVIQTFTYTGAIQIFTVPAVCVNTILIEVYGAKGAGLNGGLGARMSGVFSVTPGQVFYVLAGGAGSLATQGMASGGGGSFVSDALNNPVIVAGGGGGSAADPMNSFASNVGINANITINGNDGYGALNQQGSPLNMYYGIAGVNGNGATMGAPALGFPHAGNGGGFFTDGASGSCGGPGMAFLNGGAGGGPCNLVPNTPGGFGGGGGNGNYGGGGGGGYSGGGGSWHYPTNGGGGGSFNSALSQTNTAAVSAGNGSVIISYTPGISVIASPPVFCYGGSTTLTAYSGNSYTWNTGSNSNSIVVNPLTTSSYTLIGTMLSGCPQQTVVTTVTVNPLPTLSVSSNVNPLCNSSTAILTASGASSYTWLPANVTGIMQSINPLTTTVYSVSGTNNNGCVNSTTFTQMVSPPATITVNSSSLAVCPGSVFSVSASGGSTYTWLPSSVQGSVFTGTANAPAVYTVTGATAVGCLGSATVALSLQALPVLSFQTASITCASLGSATVNPSGAVGPYSYTWNPTAQTTSVANSLNPGTYSLNVYDVGTGCVSTATTVFTSLIPLTGNLNFTPSLSCNGVNTGTANYTNLAGGSGNEFYFWTNGSSSHTLPNPTNMAAGQWSVTVTDVLTGCTINNTFVITQPPPLVVNLSSPNTTLCAGSSMLLSSFVTGGTAAYTYSWSSGVTTANQTISQLTGGTYVYSLTVKDSYSCTVGNSITINFINNPVVSVSNVSICPAATGTLIASGASNYTWTGGANGFSFTAAPFSSFLYGVTGEALGCTSTNTALMYMMLSPTVQASNSGPVCNGGSLTLSGAGGVSYLWQGPGSFTSNLQNPIINPVNTASNGVYNLTVTASNGCTASISQNVIVNATPVLSASGSTVCSGQTLYLYGNAQQGSTYLWSGPLGFSSVQQNPAVGGIGINATGIYSLQVTSVAGCTNVTTTAASVVPAPAPGGALSTYNICMFPYNGSINSVSLTLSGADSYNVIPPVGVNISSSSATNSILSPIFPYISGPVTMTIQGFNSVCSVVAYVGFNIAVNPLVSINSHSPVCMDQVATFTAQGANFYYWGASSGTVVPVGTGQLASITSSLSTVVSMYGSAGNCNSSAVTTTLLIKPLPTLSVNPTVHVCTNNTVTLTVDGNGQSYSWLPSAGLNTTFGNVVTANLSADQVYTITSTLNGCSNSTVITVSVVPLPTVAISLSKSTVCLNDTILIKGLGGLDYQWSGPFGFVTSGETFVFYANNTALNGTYQLMVTDKNGCKNTTSSGINILDLPRGTLSGTMIKNCVPYCSDFKLNSPQPVTASWIFENEAFDGTTFSVCVNSPGEKIFRARLTNTLTGCQSQQSFTINGWQKPIADFVYTPLKPIEKLDEVVFTASSPGDAPNSYNWYFTNNQGYTAEGKEASYYFPLADVYRVAMVVTNKFGCSDTIVKLITVDTDFNIFVPNAFTPNNDRLNDIFLPVGTGIKTYELNIFNRWGARLFTSSDPLKGWDGTYNHEPCNDDVYIYTMVVKDEKGIEKSLKGTLHLQR